MRVGDLAGDCDFATGGLGDASNGFGRPCALSLESLFGDFLEGFSGVLCPPFLPGESLRSSRRGGIAFGGESAMVGFRIDLT